MIDISDVAKGATAYTTPAHTLCVFIPTVDEREDTFLHKHNVMSFVKGHLSKQEIREQTVRAGTKFMDNNVPIMRSREALIM